METLEDMVDLEAPAAEERKAPSKNPRTAVAELALRGAMSPTILKVFQDTSKFAAIITVPSDQWVAPIQAALALVSRLPISLPRTQSKKGGAEHNAEISSLMATGKRVVAVTVDTSTLSPMFLGLSQYRIDIPSPSVRVIASWIKYLAPGRLPADFLELDISGLDFDMLCACLPVGTTRGEAARRISRSLQNTSPPTLRTAGLALPSLESAIEYGEAREWGLDLKRDIEDVRAGKIPWTDVDRGIVLYGEPGTGKTTFARILGAACGLKTITKSTADLFSNNGGDLGAVIKAQRKMFDEAITASPSLLFIDELNAYPNAFSLSDRGRDWWMPILMDFQLMLDSAVSSRDGVIVCGATNMIEEVSPAWLRKGRLERAVYIGPPTVEGLANILRTQLGTNIPDSALQELAYAGQGATASDAMDWVRAARRSARRQNRPVSIGDLMDRIRPRDDRPAEDVWRTAVHEAGHAIIGIMQGRTLESVSIVPARGSGGRAKFAPLHSSVVTKQIVEDNIVCGLAGRAAEIVLLGAPSAGAGGAETSDLANATRLLAQMRASLGLGEGLTWWGSPVEAPILAHRNPKIADLIESDLRRLQAVAIEMVEAHRMPIEMLAKHLIERQSLTGADIAKLLVG